MRTVKWTLYLMIVCAMVVTLPIAAFAADTDALVVDETGNVGIGTDNPTQMLEVNGSIALPSVSGRKQIYTWSGTDGNWRIGMSDNPGFSRSLATSHVQYLTYGPANGQGFAVGVHGGESSFEIAGPNHSAFFRGNVGIGTTAPSTELHIKGSTPQITMQPTDDTQSAGKLVFQNTAGTNIGQIIYDTTLKSLHFNVGGPFS